jgi:cell division initiation protein
MRLTPLDIREQQFRRVMRGLDPEEVEAFLTSVASEFELLVTSNNDLRQRVVELEEKIQEYRSMEKALRDTLLTAEKVMGDAKESAQREATLIIREAEVAAQRTKGRLQQELVQLQHQIAELRRAKDAYLTRVRWLLRSHLEMIDGHAQEFTEMDLGFGAAPAPWPAGAPSPAPPPFPPPASPAGPRTPETPPRAALGPAFAPPERLAPPSYAPAGEPLQSDDLEDVLRPVAADGTYPPAPTGYAPPPVPGYPAPGSPPAAPGPPRSSPAEEIAQAARRAERLAAEARAALERRAGSPPSSGDRPGFESRP